MKRTDQKSHCAVNFALEAIGDPWSLLIVRDIAFNGKHTFNEFLKSEERIARNILANRLVQLETYKIVERHPDPEDKRVIHYNLTEKGIRLIPVLCELSRWSVLYDPETEANIAFSERYEKDPSGMVALIQNAVRENRPAFQGEQSVLKQLNIPS